MILDFFLKLLPKKQVPVVVPTTPKPVVAPKPQENIILMTIPKRIELVPAKGLQSSYIGKKTGKRLPVEVLKESSYICPDMFEALVKLDELVRLNKGTLYITDLLRLWTVQAKLHEEYKIAKDDPNIKDKPFAAPPGGSFHQAGRAVDFDTKNLNFEGVAKEEQLDLFWTLCKPLGFKPIINIPDEGMSENWHFDFPGDDWSEAYSKMNYGEVAKCAILDIGGWNPLEDEEKVRKMFIQAQLIRLGYYEIGKVDGIIGSKTQRILEFLGMKDWDTKTQAGALAKRNR